MEFLIIIGIMLILSGIGVKNNSKYNDPLRYEAYEKMIKRFIIIGSILTFAGTIGSLINHGII